VFPLAWLRRARKFSPFRRPVFSRLARLEQIKNDVAYSNNPVNLVGISAGVSYGALGSTHHSLHDFAVLRTINNLIIVAPADNFETEQAIRLAAETDLPVYLRFGKKSMPLLSADEKTFEFGKGRIVREGSDLTIIGTGETVAPALLAAEKLQKEFNIFATVVSMHTIKPLDYTLLADISPLPENRLLQLKNIAFTAAWERLALLI
jgi:transketolase